MIHPTQHPQTFWNYIYALISVTIVLYLMGLGGTYYIKTNALVTHLQENIPFTVELKADAKESSVFALQKELEQNPYINAATVRYVSKEEGLKNLQLELDSVETVDTLLLGRENPLPNVLEFRLKSGYFNQYTELLATLRPKDVVADVWYARGFVEDQAGMQAIVKAFQQQALTLVALGLLFAFIAITLISNTLKLFFISNKSILETLQWVGATPRYIAKPYIQQSIRNGLISSLVAIVALWLTQWWNVSNLPTSDTSMASAWLYVGMLILGIGIWVGSTYRSVKKYIIEQ